MLFSFSFSVLSSVRWVKALCLTRLTEQFSRDKNVNCFSIERKSPVKLSIWLPLRSKPETFLRSSWKFPSFLQRLPEQLIFKCTMVWFWMGSIVMMNAEISGLMVDVLCSTDVTVTTPKSSVSWKVWSSVWELPNLFSVCDVSKSLLSEVTICSDGVWIVLETSLPSDVADNNVVGESVSLIAFGVTEEFVMSVFARDRVVWDVCLFRFVTESIVDWLASLDSFGDWSISKLVVGWVKYSAVDRLPSYSMFDWGKSELSSELTTLETTVDWNSVVLTLDTSVSVVSSISSVFGVTVSGVVTVSWMVVLWVSL